MIGNSEIGTRAHQYRSYRLGFTRHRLDQNLDVENGNGPARIIRRPSTTTEMASESVLSENRCTELIGPPFPGPKNQQTQQTKPQQPQACK
jgi:hypothetical protein